MAKSRYQQLIITGNAIRDAEERYYLVNGEYTDSLEKLDINININPDIYYELHDGISNTYSRVLLSSKSLGYVVFYSKGRYEANQRACLAKKDSDLAIKVCMEITGTTTITDWSTHEYRFNFK